MGFLLVTHPFHPLTGQRLKVLFIKRRGTDSLFVCAGGVSGQLTLPRSWTDRGESPVARRLSVEGLVELSELVSATRGGDGN